jgi:hypothetical protein
VGFFLEKFFVAPGIRMFHRSLRSIPAAEPLDPASDNPPRLADASSPGRSERFFLRTAHFLSVISKCELLAS